MWYMRSRSALPAALFSLSLSLSQVDPTTLRVVGFPNIFAIGDINDMPEAKSGYLAGLQGKHTAANLALLLKNKDAKLKTYKVRGRGVCVCLCLFCI